MQDLGMLSLSQEVHMFISTVVAGRYGFLGVTHTLWFLESSASSFSHSSLIPEGEGFGEDIPFRNGWSRVSHFLPIVQLWVSELVSIYCRRVLS